MLEDPGRLSGYKHFLGRGKEKFAQSAAESYKGGGKPLCTRFESAAG